MHPKDYLRLIVLNSWRADAAVWARTETMRLIRVNQLRKWRMKEIEQGWDAANSLSLTSRRNLCQIAVRSLRMIARETESSPRPDLTSDFQQKTISLECGSDQYLHHPDSRGGSKSPNSLFSHEKV